MNDPKAVGPQIRMRLPSLTPLEGKVAPDMLERRDITEATSLREVAEGSDNTSAVIEALDLARRNGARTIAVTNYADSPLSRQADVVLCSTAQNSPLLEENATARIAQLNLLDALFVVVAQSDRKAADANLSRTMRAVQSKRRG